MKRVLLLSGIHGDEPSGPRIIRKFLKICPADLIKTIDVLPDINPTGLRRKTRENAKGLDLNRFFCDRPRINEPPECRKLRKFFRSVKPPYKLAISIHEDPGRKEFYIYYAGMPKNSRTISKIFSEMKRNRVKPFTGTDDPNDPVLNNQVKKGLVRESLNEKDPALENYLTRKGYAKSSITLELPGKLSLNKKIALGVAILKEILT